jgi:SnoaL-like domain
VNDQQDVSARLAKLEARLRELEDEREIRELLSRYGYYADAALDDEYYALFTDDCVMDVSSGHEPDPYQVLRWEGQDAMREFMSVRTAGHGTGFVGRSLHMQGNNLAVAVHGDTAVANGYSFILHQDGPQIKLQSASINEWRLRRVEGRWMIVERKRRMVGSPDTPEVLRATES